LIAQNGQICATLVRPESAKGPALNLRSILPLSALAFGLCAVAFPASSAENGGMSEQQPAQTLPLPGTVASSDKPQDSVQDPVPDAGTTGQAACIDETGD
jgi:hypothetical protein